MSVPDTDNFYLQDVVDEINAENPTVDTLQECFTNSTDVKFDPLYKLYKDRLSNFRNYNNPKSVTIRPYLSYTKDKSIYMTGTYFENVRWCSGTPGLFDSGSADKHPVGVEGCGSAVFKIWRGYLSFNMELFGIANEVTIIDVALHSRRVSYSGSSIWFNAMKTDWGPTLSSEDACTDEYPSTRPPGLDDSFLTGTRSGYVQSDSSYVYKLEADKSGLRPEIALFEENCLHWGCSDDNHKIYITLINGQYDYLDSNPPVEQFNFDLYKGNNISQSLVWNTELRVEYWGFNFLNAYPNPCSKGMEDMSERIFITANDGNDWAAYVTTGDTWLSINGLSVGTGSYKFEISLTVNVSSAIRHGVITIYSDAHTSPYLIDVEQARATLSVNPNPLNISYADFSYWVSVTTESGNVWEATVRSYDQGWLSIVSGGNGTGNGSFQVHVDKNEDVDPREGSIFITSYAVECVLYVNQEVRPLHPQ